MSVPEGLGCRGGSAPCTGLPAFLPGELSVAGASRGVLPPTPAMSLVPRRLAAEQPWVPEPAPARRSHCTLHPAPGIYDGQYTGSRGRGQDTQAGGRGLLHSWGRKPRGPGRGPATSSTGLAQESRGRCPEKPGSTLAPSSALRSTGATLLGVGGGEAAQSPHAPAGRRPSACFVSMSVGWRKDPARRTDRCCPTPGTTPRSWNVKGNSSVQGGGR